MHRAVVLGQPFTDAQRREVLELMSGETEPLQIRTAASTQPRFNYAAEVAAARAAAKKYIAGVEQYRREMSVKPDSMMKKLLLR